MFLWLAGGGGAASLVAGKESTYQSRGHRFDPLFGKTLRVAEQRSPCATITEPVLSSSVQALQLLSPPASATEARAPGAGASQPEEPPQREASAGQLESSPRSRQN